MSARASFLLTIVLFAGSLSIQRLHALDLLAYFDFDDDSNPTVALDVSGNAPDAVLNGPAAFTASVRFLRSGDQTQLGEDVPIDMTVFDSDDVTIEVSVPGAAIGEAVLIEFNFTSDGSADTFSGLSLDNVNVQIP